MVFHDTEVQVVNVVEEIDVADDVPDIGSPIKKKDGGKKFHVNVPPSSEVLIQTV